MAHERILTDDEADAAVMACAEAWHDHPESESLRELPGPEGYDRAVVRVFPRLVALLGSETAAFLQDVCHQACTLHLAPWGSAPGVDRLEAELFFLPVSGPAEHIAALMADPAHLADLAAVLNRVTPEFGESCIRIFPGLMETGRLITLKTLEIRTLLAIATGHLAGGGPLCAPPDDRIAEILAQLDATPGLTAPARSIASRCLVGVWLRRITPGAVSDHRPDEAAASARYVAETRRIHPALAFGTPTEPYGAAAEMVIHEIQLVIDQRAAMAGLPYDARPDRIDVHPSEAGIDIVVTYGAVTISGLGVADVMLPFVLQDLLDTLALWSDSVVQHEDAYAGPVERVH